MEGQKIVTSADATEGSAAKKIRESSRQPICPELIDLPCQLLSKIAMYTIQNDGIINGYGTVCRKLFESTNCIPNRTISNRYKQTQSSKNGKRKKKKIPAVFKYREISEAVTYLFAHEGGNTGQSKFVLDNFKSDFPLLFENENLICPVRKNFHLSLYVENLSESTMSFLKTLVNLEIASVKVEECSYKISVLSSLPKSKLKALEVIPSPIQYLPTTDEDEEIDEEDAKIKRDMAETEKVLGEFLASCPVLEHLGLDIIDDFPEECETVNKLVSLCLIADGEFTDLERFSDKDLERFSNLKSFVCYTRRMFCLKDLPKVFPQLTHLTLYDTGSGADTETVGEGHLDELNFILTKCKNIETLCLKKFHIDDPEMITREYVNTD